MSSANPDSSLPQSNTTSGFQKALSFSAKEDIPPITLGILIVVVNGLVLILVSKRKHLRTITNLLLCSLAFSDLLTGLASIPLFMTCNLLRQSGLCISADQMLRFTSVSAVCHLVAVSVDRYLAIIHSLRYKSIVTLPRCLSVMFFIWILSAIIALIQLSWIDPANHNVYKEATAELIRKEIIYDSVSLVIFFLVPLVCMAFVYAKIFSEVSRQINNIKKGSFPSWQQAQEMRNAERRVITIFAVMLIVYAMCWLPYFILRFIFHDEDLHPLVAHISTWLRFLTSFLNPCLYIFGKKDFREALKRKKLRGEQCEIFFLVDRLERSG